MRKRKSLFSDLTSIHATLSQISGVPARSVQSEKATIIRLQLLTGQVVRTVVSNTRVTRLGFGAWTRAYKFEQERRNEKMKVQHSPPPPLASSVCTHETTKDSSLDLF